MGPTNINFKLMNKSFPPLLTRHIFSTKIQCTHAQIYVVVHE